MQPFHCVGLGVSGSGKSTLFREGHEKFDGVSIIINHGDGAMDRVAGHRAVGPKALATGVEKFDDWADVQINLICDDPNDGLELAIRFAVDVWDTAGVPTQIGIDEFHHCFGEDSPEPVPQEHPFLWALTEGRDKGIKIFAFTQSPDNVPYTKFESVRYIVWVGEYSNTWNGFINHYGFDEDDLPDEQFQVVVFNRKAQPIYQTQTNENYA